MCAAQQRELAIRPLPLLFHQPQPSESDAGTGEHLDVYLWVDEGADGNWLRRAGSGAGAVAALAGRGVSGCLFCCLDFAGLSFADLLDVAVKVTEGASGSMRKAGSFFGYGFTMLE